MSSDHTFLCCQPPKMTKVKFFVTKIELWRFRFFRSHATLLYSTLTTPPVFNPICGITRFFWEIGFRQTKLAAITGMDNSKTPTLGLALGCELANLDKFPKSKHTRFLPFLLSAFAILMRKSHTFLLCQPRFQPFAFDSGFCINQ